jgi:excinuclease ABC subunit A
LPQTESPARLIRVRGARVHNLRDLDVDIPRDQLVVITGVSGSGKSSLAFDTLFAEGQRRYIETLSAQSRALLDQMQRPDVDWIDGLPPTLSVEQRVGAVNPRSTLATTTGIHDFFRLLYARAGTPHCPRCGKELSQQSVQAIVDSILALEAGRKVMIAAPLVRGKKGTHRDLFEKICREGFVRARVDGQLVDAGSPPALKKSKPHDIDVIVDRIVIKDGLRARLHESVELALQRGNGSCLASHENADHEGQLVWFDRLFSSRFACPDCELSFPEIEPRTFSFNSPYGACPKCMGLGTIEPAAAAPLAGSDLQRIGRGGFSAEICPECRGARLAPVGRAVLLAGRTIHGLLALTVSEAEHEIGDLLSQLGTSNLSGSDSPGKLTPQARLVAAKILPEIHRRLQFLLKVGVDYLSLDRPTQTLSGGEFQRARIAGSLGAGLIGVCYILDEPTVGLHPRDTARLLESLFDLRDQGNSVIVVEHDLDVMARADCLIDLGPGAGREGGQLVACGAPGRIVNDESSLTGRWLRERFERRPPKPTAVRSRINPNDKTPAPQICLQLAGASARNLKNLTADFPLAAFTCVTGVSGSGKSTLVMETLVPKLRAALAARQWRESSSNSPVDSAAAALANVEHSGAAGSLTGSESIDRLAEINQAPLGRNARSNPATVSGMWDELRKIFARTRDARVRGFRSGRFSFNAAGGRCEECHGLGTRRVSMQFLPDIDIVCPICRGARFNRQTLQVKFRGKSVADVLNMRVDEAAAFFEGFSLLHAMLKTFVDVGLGYLTLGQSAATLSGGEAQRIKLAAELGRRHVAAPAGPARGRTLYVLDEPTTGLHPADINRLLDLLERLVDEGHTVLVVEHQLDVIARADWVIDLGPEGGKGGGRIIAAGTPQEIARVAESYTGQALRAILPSE